MNLEYPHNTPDLWEGPLPVPYKKLKMPITSIMEDVFIEPHTLPSHPVEMAQEEYPDDLYMDLWGDPVLEVAQPAPVEQQA